MSGPPVSRPPLSPLRVSRKPAQRVWAGLWAVTAVPWIAAAVYDGSAGFFAVALGWTLVAAWMVADLQTRATVHQGRLLVRRFGRDRETSLVGARVQARRREVNVLIGDDVALRYYPDRDQVSVGKDPRPIPGPEVTEALLARIDEADAAA